MSFAVPEEQKPNMLKDILNPGAGAGASPSKPAGKSPGFSDILGKALGGAVGGAFMGAGEHLGGPSMAQMQEAMRQEEAMGLRQQEMQQRLGDRQRGREEEEQKKERRNRAMNYFRTAKNVKASEYVDLGMGFLMAGDPEMGNFFTARGNDLADEEEKEEIRKNLARFVKAVTGYEIPPGIPIETALNIIKNLPTEEDKKRNDKLLDEQLKFNEERTKQAETAGELQRAGQPIALEQAKLTPEEKREKEREGLYKSRVEKARKLGLKGQELKTFALTGNLHRPLQAKAKTVAATKAESQFVKDMLVSAGVIDPFDAIGYEPPEGSLEKATAFLEQALPELKSLGYDRERILALFRLGLQRAGLLGPGKGGAQVAPLDEALGLVGDFNR